MSGKLGDKFEGSHTKAAMRTRPPACCRAETGCDSCLECPVPVEVDCLLDTTGGINKTKLKEWREYSRALLRGKEKSDEKRIKKN